MLKYPIDFEILEKHMKKAEKKEIDLSLFPNRTGINKDIIDSLFYSDNLILPDEEIMEYLQEKEDRYLKMKRHNKIVLPFLEIYARFIKIAYKNSYPISESELIHVINEFESVNTKPKF